MGALLAVPLTIAMRSILMPFAGAHWFVGDPGARARAKPETVERPTPTGASVR